MRTIADYEELLAGLTRSAKVQVLVGPSALDVSAYVESAEVTDSLDAQASTASIELSKESGVWDDPGLPGVSSPLAAGNTLMVLIKERGMADWLAIFSGEIVSGSNPAEHPAQRVTIQAISGKQLWWKNPRTSPVYTSAETVLIVTELFEAFGDLVAPTDFDLPAGSRVLARAQCVGRSIMGYCYDLLTPWGYVPWWDAEQGKLSTLDCAIPAPGSAVSTCCCTIASSAA